MKKFKRLLRQNKTLVNVIIVLIGIVLIVVSPWLKSPYAQTIFSGIGTSFLASGVVVLITLVLTDHTEEQENLSKWGLEAIYLTRGEMNVSCDQYLKKCRKLDIIAFGLRSFRDSQEKVIEKLKDQYNYSRKVRSQNDNDYFQYWDGRTDSYKDAIEIVKKGGIE